MIQVLKPYFSNTDIRIITKEIKKALKSGWLGMGPKTEEFEKKWAEYTGAKYAVATNSCTSALDIAVRIADLPKKVKVPAFTFISSALSPYNAGYGVELVDIDEDTLCAKDADITVHYSGVIYSSKSKIHDMAHCGGAKHQDPISCWSFHPVKNLPTNDGGMITMNDKKQYEMAKALSWCGIDKSTWARSGKTYSWDYSIDMPGLKAHMNDITAIIGLRQLETLNERNIQRQHLAFLYDHYLPGEVVRSPNNGVEDIRHIYVIRHPKRDKIQEHLKKNGIGTSVHYKPLYNYPMFKQKKLPITEKVFNQALTLPLHIHLKEKDIKRICKLTKEAIK